MAAVIETQVDVINRVGLLMDLEDARELLVLPDAAHELVIVGSDPQAAGALAARLATLASLAGTEVLDWRKLSPEFANLTDLLWAYEYFILVLVFVAAAAGAANTMMMATFERTREFGMLLALGAKPGRLVALVVTEGVPQADATAPWRVVPLEGSLSNGPSYSYWHEVDRLALSFHLPKVELTLGRQALGWGRGMLFGAVDLFAPFTPLEVDREWRRGVDAVRLDVQLGAKASAELVGVFGDRLERSAFAGRLRGYLGPLDAELVGGWRAKDWFAGLTASASLFDAELHGELAVFYLPEPWRWGGAFGNDRVVIKAVLGASYQFNVGEGLRAVVEYHASGFGLPFPVSALDLATDAALQARFQRGDFQFLGRHVLGASLSYPVDLTLATSLQVLVDPLDGSGVVAPSVNWDLAENVSLLASAYLGWGALPRALELRSQLGATPLTVLVQLRVYDQRNLERRAPNAAPEIPYKRSQGD